MRVLASSALALSLAVLLAACGGDDEGVIVDERDPSSSGRAASVTVPAASNAVLIGTYATTDIFLNNVTKVNPIGGDPETCRFRFDRLTQQVGARNMNGDIRYIPGSTEVRTTFVAIDTVEFRLQGTTGASVDRANNRIVYTNAVLTSTQGTGQTITLSGAIPMLPNRPEGC
jgi:hypothetical protein